MNEWAARHYGPPDSGSVTGDPGLARHALRRGAPRHVASTPRRGRSPTTMTWIWPAARPAAAPGGWHTTMAIRSSGGWPVVPLTQRPAAAPSDAEGTVFAGQIPRWRVTRVAARGRRRARGAHHRARVAGHVSRHRRCPVDRAGHRGQPGLWQRHAGSRHTAGDHQEDRRSRLQQRRAERNPRITARRGRDSPQDTCLFYPGSGLTGRGNQRHCLRGSGS
jgi:hypothetical protein